MTRRRVGIVYLTADAAGAAAWWGVLLAWPPARGPFHAAGAPDATLLAFAPGDLLMFVGTAAVAGYGLWMDRAWAWPVLCVHAGAAGYAGLYCWTLAALTGGDGLLGAVLMSPSLVVPGLLVVGLRPGRRGC